MMRRQKTLTDTNPSLYSDTPEDSKVVERGARALDEDEEAGLCMPLSLNIRLETKHVCHFLSVRYMNNGKSCDQMVGDSLVLAMEELLGETLSTWSVMRISLVRLRHIPSPRENMSTVNLMGSGVLSWVQ